MSERLFGRGPGHFELWQHWFSRQWRFRFVAGNGKTIAHSGESYHNRADAEAAIAALCQGVTSRIDVQVPRGHNLPPPREPL